MSARARLVLWAPVALLLAYEFWLSGRAASALPRFLSFAGGDKVVHALYFCLTGFLAVRAARFGEGWSQSKTAVSLILAGLLWACSDEIHQAYTPGRSVEIADVAADVAGVALGLAFGEKILRRTGLDQTVI